MGSEISVYKVRFYKTSVVSHVISLFYSRHMPFGAGRRVCVAEAMAKRRMCLFTTALLQNFTFMGADELPNSEPRNYRAGLIMKVDNYRLRAVPRL